MNKRLLFYLTLYTCGSLTIYGQGERWKDKSFVSALDTTIQFYAEWLPPDFDRERSCDLIIGLHGHGSDRWQFVKDPRGECSSFRDFAATHQMIAVSPDYRPRTSWMGPAAEEDMLQLIRELKSQYRIRRIFLAGGSMGATAALTFTALHPDLIAGVVALNGLANHLEYDRFQDAIAASFGGSKRKIPAEYKKRSAEYWPERLTMPVAFTVGMNDSIVPPDSVIRLSHILTKLGNSVLLNIDSSGGHATNYQDATLALEFVLEKASK